MNPSESTTPRAHCLHRGLTGRYARVVATLMVLSLAIAACTPGQSTGAGTEGNTAQGAQTVVTPNYAAHTIVVNVTLTDEGTEPATIFIPAGQHIRLVIRNRGTTEHHFRVPGLITTELTWLKPAEFTQYDIADMTTEELAAIGIDEQVDDIEHVLHHLTPTFVPFKEPSMTGIKPLPGEVHGYAAVGNFDVLSFFALSPGVFTAEDVRFPELTTRVVVFETETT